MSKKTKTISFRLPVELVQKLEDYSELHRVSCGTWVRRAIEQQLADPITSQELMQKLISIDDNLARVLFYSLTQVGSMPKSEASDLVRSKLKRS